MLSQATSTLSRPAPCSELTTQVGKAYCTCRCCFEGYCPNSFEGYYNAHTYSNVGDPAAACNEALCRLHFGRKGSCPSHGEGGEVYLEDCVVEARLGEVHVRKGISFRSVFSDLLRLL